MPTLPIYNAQRNINAGTAEPLRNEATQPFADQQKILGTMQDITKQWSDANDVMQYTEAKAKNGVAIADIESRAATDPDFKNSETYYKQLEEAKKISASGISNQQVASKVATEFDYDSHIAAIKINAGFQKKQIEYNQVMVKTNLDTLMQKKLASATPDEAKQYDLQVISLIDANLKTGVLSPADADKLLKDSQETSVKYEVYADNATQEKDSTLLKELKDPKGKYSFLDPDTRLKMIEEDQRRIFQNNQTVKRETEVAKDDRFNNIFTKANEGTLTLNDLDNEMAVPEDKGGIPKKQLLDIRKSLQTRIKSDLETVVDNNTKAGDYLKFVDNFISDETDRQKGREAIVNAFKDNILSPKEAEFLNKLKRESEDIQWSRTKDGMATNNLIPFKNAISAIHDWFSGTEKHDEKDAAYAVKKLLNGAADGQNPEAIAQQIFSDVRSQMKPEIKSFPVTGKVMVDKNGNKAKVFPDGHIEEVK